MGKIDTVQAAGSRERRGSVLLLSLLIMSTVIVSSVGLSSIILSSLQQSRVIDNSVTSYYAAETAVEDALYASKLAVDRIPPSAPTRQLSNGATWSREVVTADNVLFTVIPENDFVEVSLYDPLQPIVATDVTRLRVWWTDDCGGCTAIQASLVGWLPQLLVWDIDSSAETHRVSSADSPLSLPLADPTRLYRLRLKALGGTLKNVEVRLYDDANEPQPIPGRINISARGGFSTAQQRITVTLPQREPALGLLDYAIYSECSIVKGGPATCPNPISQ